MSFIDKNTLDFFYLTEYNLKFKLCNFTIYNFNLCNSLFKNGVGLYNTIKYTTHVLVSNLSALVRQFVFHHQYHEPSFPCCQ